MDPCITDRLTKPSKVHQTSKQPICQVVYILVFCLVYQEYNYSSWDLVCPDVPKKAKWLEKKYVKHFFKVTNLHRMPPNLSAGGLLPNFQKRGLIGSQFLEVHCQKRGGDFFIKGRNWCSFYITNKLKSEILNKKKTKKIKQKQLPAITKNLNWQILTNNGVTFEKIGWSFKDEKL